MKSLYLILSKFNKIKFEMLEEINTKFHLPWRKSSDFECWWLRMLEEIFNYKYLYIYLRFRKIDSWEKISFSGNIVI